MYIESYSFGLMTIDGKIYGKDLIVFNERIIPNWWRKSGHALSIDDLDEVLKYKPDILVVGTGASGMMQVPEITKKGLKNKNISIIEEDTGVAYQTFNNYIEEGRRVAGAFHLTC